MVLTQKELEAKKKTVKTELIKKEKKEVVQQEVKKEIKRYYLQHPDQIPANNINCSFVVDGEQCELINGRIVTTNEKLAQALLCRNYIMYKREEVLNGN